MTRAEKTAAWSAPTSTREAHARARGRAKYIATLKWRAKQRRKAVATCLDTLRREALTRPGSPPGFVPGGVPRGPVATLAAEFHVTEDTIRRDLTAIHEAELAALVQQPKPPRKTIRDPRFQWAYRPAHPRPRILTRKVIVKLPPALVERLQAFGPRSTVVRHACEAFVETHTGQTAHEAALLILQTCDPDTQDALARRAEQMNLPLLQGLVSALVVACQRPQESVSLAPPAANRSWREVGGRVAEKRCVVGRARGGNLDRIW